jgi:hypothetical protein
MNKNTAIAFISLAYLTIGAQQVNANDGKFASEWIGVASYKKQRDLTKTDLASTKNISIAEFTPVCTLQGPTCVILRMRYCDEWLKANANNSSQDSVKVPEQNSKWILLIPDGVSFRGGFRTYNEYDGRIPYTLENLNSVLDGMERVNPSRIFKPALRSKIQKLIEDWQPDKGDLAHMWNTDHCN